MFRFLPPIGEEAFCAISDHRWLSVNTASAGSHKWGGTRKNMENENEKTFVPSPLAKHQVDAASLLKQLHLRSCGLVVLSRGGLVDDVHCVEDAERRITAGQEAKREDDDEESAVGEKGSGPVRVFDVGVVGVAGVAFSICCCYCRCINYYMVIVRLSLPRCSRFFCSVAPSEKVDIIQETDRFFGPLEWKRNGLFRFSEHADHLSHGWTRGYPAIPSRFRRYVCLYRLYYSSLAH